MIILQGAIYWEESHCYQRQTRNRHGAYDQQEIKGLSESAGVCESQQVSTSKLNISQYAVIGITSLILAISVLIIIPVLISIKCVSLIHNSFCMLAHACMHQPIPARVE